MRRMNALQAVLAGIGGGLEGQAAQRAREDELRRFDEDRLYQRQRDAAASERQALLDAVALAEKGYVEQGERQETVKRAAPALENALVNAGGMLTGQAPSRPMDSAALRAAAGQFGPAVSSVQVGGKTFERAQTPNQERAMRAAQERQDETFAAQQESERLSRVKQADVQEKARVIQQAIPALNMEQAVGVANGIPLSQFIQDPAELAKAKLAERQLALQSRGLDLRERELDATMGLRQEKAQAEKAKQTAAQQSLQSVLPTVVNAAKALSTWGDKEIKEINPTSAAVMSNFSISDNPMAPLGAAMASRFTSPTDRRYLQYARAVSDAVARSSETGVLSNADIKRYNSQVSFSGGETPDDVRFKLGNLQQWANWLATNKGMLDNPQNRAILPQMPGETAAEFAARTGRGPF